MAQRHQRGWLKKETRSQGETWVLFYRTTRKSDGKRVENKIPIGLVKDFPEMSAARIEVERLHLRINAVNSRRGVTFGELAQHYAEHELADQAESIHAKAHTTVRSYERIIRNRLLPRWGYRIAVGIEPLEVERWLKDLKREREFANPTLDKTRRVMSLIYKHGQRYGLIPRTQESNPMRFVRCKTTSPYEAMILTPEQAYAVLLNLQEPEHSPTDFTVTNPKLNHQGDRENKLPENAVTGQRSGEIDLAPANTQHYYWYKWQTPSPSGLRSTNR